MNNPNSITVLIDNREKRPLLFPSYITIDHPRIIGKTQKIKVITQSIHLPAGDYLLKGYSDCCIAERKGSQSEVIHNLFNPKDSARQGRALKKLVSACRHPILLLEVSPSKLLSPSGFLNGWDPDVLLHRITRTISQYNLQVLWLAQPASVSARRNLGTALLHLMLSYILYPSEKEII